MHFAQKFSRRPKVPDSTARVTYLSMWIHPKCCLFFPLKVDKLYLVVQGKEQLDHRYHIVEASCKHFKPWNILQEWPNKQAHLELCHRNSGILQRILNPIMLSNSTVGKCAPMQVIKQPDHGRTTEEQKWSYDSMIHSW